jgi:hypothetical protein
VTGPGVHDKLRPVTGLSVADIDRWKPGDVREVFHAARSRAEANQFARDGLATLPAFQSWGGVAADAAKNAVEQTRKEMCRYRTARPLSTESAPMA